MRIAIVGAGGVGGYFGARLAQAGEDVFFIARGEHLAAMQRHGLRIESPKGNVHLTRVNATSDPADLEPVEVVFSTVKMYDAASVIPLIRPIVRRHTVIIPFQNGVDSVDVLRAAFPPAQVAGGTAHITARIAEPGLIIHTALDRLIFGMPGHAPSATLAALRDAGIKGGFDAVLSDQIEAEIWMKFTRLTVFSGMTSICRSSIGPIRSDPALMAMMEAAWRESVTVALARKVGVPASTMNDLHTAVNGLPPHARSSMLEDLEHGRRLELRWLSETLVRVGDELGIDTPTHRLFVTLLRIHADGKAAIAQ